jgi:hypothetical protein
MRVVDINHIIGENDDLLDKDREDNKCKEFYNENWPIILCVISFISIVTIAIILSLRMS